MSKRAIKTIEPEKQDTGLPVQSSRHFRKKKSADPLISVVEDIVDREFETTEKINVVTEETVTVTTQENTRVCSGCGIEKPMSKFNFLNKEKNMRMYICKECEKSKNKEKHDRRRTLISELKKGNCVICGESEPCCLDFHHIDSEHKEFTLGSALNKTDKKIIAEAAKCVVVCSNCHRKIHAGLLDIFDYINPAHYKYLRLLVEAAQNNVAAQEKSQGIQKDEE